jgi:hypothetical protein
MFHADQMPQLKPGRAEAREVSPGLWAVTVEIKNEHAIPTRSRHAADHRIGLPDLLTASGDGVRVSASGRLQNWLDDSADLVDKEPARVLVQGGVGPHAILTWRFFVESPAGKALTVRYEAQKAQTLEIPVKLGG